MHKHNPTRLFRVNNHWSYWRFPFRENCFHHVSIFAETPTRWAPFINTIIIKAFVGDIGGTKNRAHAVRYLRWGNSAGWFHRAYPESGWYWWAMGMKDPHIDLHTYTWSAVICVHMDGDVRVRWRWVCKVSYWSGSPGRVILGCLAAGRTAANPKAKGTSSRMRDFLSGGVTPNHQELGTLSPRGVVKTLRYNKKI